MDKGRPSFNSKVDVFVPLYVGRYLQDTTQLDGAESGFYLHFIMHLWTSGPLPNDDVALARIAKTSVDAWSIAKHRIMPYFFLGSDGLLHQRGAERLITQWSAKRLKAHEKAQKAAQARWAKRRASRNEEEAKKSDAPSIANAMPYNGKYEVQKPLPPTPSAARRGSDGETGKARATQPASSPAAVIPAAAQARAATPKRNKSETTNFAAERPRGHRDGAVHPKNSSASSRTANNHSAPGAQNGVGPRKPGAREAALKGEILRFWKAGDAGALECPWTPAEDRALLEFMEVNPSLKIESFRLLLRNRAASDDVNMAAPPRKWLRDLVKYAAGPLDRFDKPLRKPRAL